MYDAMQPAPGGQVRVWVWVCMCVRGGMRVCVPRRPPLPLPAQPPSPPPPPPPTSLAGRQLHAVAGLHPRHAPAGCHAERVAAQRALTPRSSCLPACAPRLSHPTPPLFPPPNPLPALLSPPPHPLLSNPRPTPHPALAPVRLHPTHPQPHLLTLPLCLAPSPPRPPRVLSGPFQRLPVLTAATHARTLHKTSGSPPPPPQQSTSGGGRGWPGGQ